MRLKPIALLLLLVFIVSVICTGFWIVQRSHNGKIAALLPTTIASQVNFVAFIPDSGWEQTSEPTYQKEVLTLHVRDESTDLTISEQATPEIFNDVPQYYPTLIDKLNQYGSVGSANGTAYLTKPTELKGQQQAVLNNNGTLLFIHPSKDMTNDQWRRFFNGLEVVKPS